MQADLPHTLYNTSKGGVKQDDIDEATRLTIEAAERKKKAKEQEQYTVEDVFDGTADEE